MQIYAAPPKSSSRMRDKLLKYAPPHPKAIWPLAANILDPVQPPLAPLPSLRYSTKNKQESPLGGRCSARRAREEGLPPLVEAFQGKLLDGSALALL